MMASAQIQEFQLKSELESLIQVEQIVEDLRLNYSIPEELYGNILVAVTEATNNAIKHGNKLDSSKNVFLAFENSELEFQFTIKDEGLGFNPDTIPDPTLEENITKPDGRGIFIIRNLSDNLEFNDEGREIRMTFKRKHHTP